MLSWAEHETIYNLGERCIHKSDWLSFTINKLPMLAKPIKATLQQFGYLIFIFLVYFIITFFNQCFELLIGANIRNLKKDKHVHIGMISYHNFVSELKSLFWTFISAEIHIRKSIEDNSKIIFLFVNKNICSDPSLKPSWWDCSNDGSQNMFLWKKKYLCYPFLSTALLISS